MTTGRWFIDTAFVQALFSRTDQFHDVARKWSGRLRSAAELWTTGAVLLEIGNVLAPTNRSAAADFIRQAYRTPEFYVVSADEVLIQRSLQLFESRPDKRWSLTDCMSFIVMADHGLTEALTADHHFEQAGFLSLLLREPPTT